jgi:hypothetical protein
MEITIRNEKTKEEYKTNSLGSLSQLKDLRYPEDNDKYFRASQINRIRDAGFVEIDDQHYSKLLEYDKKYGYIINEEKTSKQEKNTRWQDDPATQRQYDYIKLLGYNVEHNLTKGQASQVIDMIKSGEASAINLFKSGNQPTNEIYGDFG